METRYVLHMFSPLHNASPFDVNMAAEAGYEIVVPYTDVTLDEVMPLTQDAIFSRPPNHAGHTGIFIGGRDAGLALDMLEQARRSMFPPFQVSVMADPSGSFTTAAAMVAVVEKHLPQGLKDVAVQVYGATGVVGGIVAVIAAREGARVTLVSHRGLDAVRGRAEEFKQRFGVDLDIADAADAAGRQAVLPRAEVVLAAGKAGVRVLSKDDLRHAAALRVAADINAVPPLGVEGVDLKDDGKPVEGTQAVGVGALAIGNVKFQTQLQLMQRMRGGGAPVYLGFQDAFELARDLVRQQQTK